ncbi:hypothetical protein ASC94_25360 [Massilia sp. Root418]|uniref:hypothetical protein n=1 Tax=Massilia sp. Root418 TaxID=1736532 RepID=UPI0006FC396A|nr:hypothetical protein [Massilia sp. Root418]KQW87829.1 hypothetical protein ASC94_25360 [Massilia sp. Root418]
MRIDKLQIALRPRPAPQALDLGFALLRAHAGPVYKTWLALWLPLCGLALLLIWAAPSWAALWMFLPWWLRPLLERGPLYVLSRQVFGEDVTWRQALRAWPRQLGGGWFRLMTWWRLFMPGRGLYQPIWQLEQARGATASERRHAIGRNGTGAAAYRFGLACAHFEAVLNFGLMALVGLFLSDGPAVNPFAIFSKGASGTWLDLVAMAAYAVAAGIVGPVYTACCFTLYLNRRATLEAWDIEITLRQIQAPAARHQPQPQAGHASPLLLGWLAMLALAAALAVALPAAPGRAEPLQAAAPPPAPGPDRIRCARPPHLQNPIGKHAPARSAEQAALQQEIKRLYDSDDLRGYKCEDSWHLKDFDAPEPEKPLKMPDLSLLALAIKVLLIAGGVVLLAWLLYRYRGKFAWLLPAPAVMAATEIAGLDIRAESLPADVADAVRSLWEQGERRGALALLYRATLSRLVQQDGLQLAQGATEGECLRMAQQAGLAPARYGIAATATTLWLNGAYGARWPDSAALYAACDAWRAQFDAATGAHAGAHAGTPAGAAVGALASAPANVHTEAHGKAHAAEATTPREHGR